MKQAINQKINQTSKQSNKQSINQTIKQSNNETINQSMKQSNDGTYVCLLEGLCLPIRASNDTGIDSLALRHFSFIFLFKQKKHKNLLKNRKKSIPK